MNPAGTRPPPPTLERGALLAPPPNDGSALEESTWRTRLRKFNRRFFRGQPLNVLGVLIVVGFLILVAFGERWRSSRPAYGPNAPKISDKLTGPPQSTGSVPMTWTRCVSRVISGGNIRLGVAVVILALAVTTGAIIGAAAGYFGGWVDEVLMRVTDMFLAFPALILAIAISATLGPSLRNAVISLSTRPGRGMPGWCAVRCWRSRARLRRSRPLASACRGSGCCTGTSCPARISVVIIQMTLDVGYAILATSSLSFIGLGAQPPTPEWGAMISSARNYFRDAWWYITFPGTGADNHRARVST